MAAIIKWVEQINSILNDKWAPIPADVPDDEYESYAMELASLIQRHATDDQLIAHLEWAECDHIGLGRPFDRERAVRVIEALRDLGVPNPN